MLEKSLQSIFRRSGTIELADGIGFLFSICFSFLAEWSSAIMLLLIIGISLIARFVLCGYWFLYPFHATTHKWCPQKDLIYKMGICCKVTLYIIYAIVAIVAFFDEAEAISLAIGMVCLQLVAAIGVFEALRTLAHVLHKSNRSWLGSTNGKLGPLEFNTILCGILSLLSAHIIATGCFAGQSPYIAIILIAIYVLLAEPINAATWRFFEPVNRLHNWYELGAQKLFFACNIIAIVIALTKKQVLMFDWNVAVFVLIAAILAIAKDVIMAYLHIKGSWDLSHMSRYSEIAETARRWFGYACVITGIVCFVIASELMACILVIMMLTIVALSIICLVIAHIDMDQSSYEEPY